ncbi:MAG TPA: hypothetical protein O0X59_00740 [Methanocorpusculum sp.]|nr:hypothetical protein [Methanocorpusculum sp.]HJK44597.1 hypothetical protein [Methanocorpusculum sp.]HJK74919.1 hypothetical protein [Methanocorpusculum sp.]
MTEDIFEWTGRRELTEADRRYAKKMHELLQTHIDEERKGIFRVTPGYEEKQKRTHKGTLRPGKLGQRTRAARSSRSKVDFADQRYAKKIHELLQTHIDEERKGIFRVTPGYEEKQKRTHKGTLRPGKPGQRTRVERSTDRLPHRTRNTEYLSVDW